MRTLFRIHARTAAAMVALVLTNLATAQNFTLTMQPSSLVTLIPGQSVSFVISMTPVDGFNSQVTLSTTNLPTGVTASFSPSQLTPPGTSLLQVSAATNAELGSFTLNVTAVGGGLTNTTSSSVTVNFGLLPLCYGAYQGQVTDFVTGLPVTNAFVDVYYDAGGAYVNSSGFYIITNVPLGAPDNTPLNYALYASATGYWNSGYTNAYAVCDATNTVNLQMVRMIPGSISGQVFYQGGALATGVVVSASGQEYTSTTTSTNGTFQFSGLTLYNNNGPASYSVYSEPAGYWESTTNTIVGPDSNSVVTLTLIPQCLGTVTGQVVFANSGLPATNTGVTIGGGYYQSYAVTGSNGNYIATNVYLAFDNGSITPYADASYSGYYSSSTNASVSLTCGSTVGMPTLVLQPIPVTIYNYGAITGHVYDIQTALPVAGVEVYDPYSYTYAYTDTNGGYFMTNILIGTGAITNGSTYVYAIATGYFESGYSNVTVYASEVSTQDLQILRMGYGYVAGTVQDSASLLPVPGAYVSIIEGYSGTNGHYATGPLQLTSGNNPTYESFYAQANGYWTTYTNTTITNGLTNIVNIELIKVCSGATIVGNVVNALTQQPITNATVSVSGSSVYRSDMTDTNGNFILTNITVGNDNSPIATTVTASAPGFNSQSKNITIFCDATISTVFGAAETVFGGIDGYVTNAVSGLPLTNVFIGTGFGGATTTDTNGYYSFTQVPLGANGASIAWTVSAIPNGYPQQTKSVTVMSNTVSRLDFSFGQPPTALVVMATGTPNPDDVGNNLLYLVTLTNSVADAQDVVLADTLPPGVTFVRAAFTNSPGTPFSAPVYSNNVVTTTASQFNSDSAVELAILVTPTVAGTLTNTATVSTTTPDLDPTGSNHTATVTTPVIGPLTLTCPANITNVATGPIEEGVVHADLSVATTQAGAPGVLYGATVFYTITTSGGCAPVEVDSEPPSGSTFPVGVTTVNVTVTDNCENQQTCSFTVTITPPPLFLTCSSNLTITATSTNGAVVSYTNSTSGGCAPVTVNSVPPSGSTFPMGTTTVMVTATDECSNNVSCSFEVTVVSNQPPAGLSVLSFGAITFNPQTGLFQQPVVVTNGGGGAAAAVLLTVSGLPSSVVLYNSRGTTNSTPYVQYDQAVPVGGSVTFLLEYYEASRQPFTSTSFAAVAVSAAPPAGPTGTVVALDRPPFMSEGEVTIEFASVPGDTYVVQYSTNATPPQWETAVPPIVANGTETQWIDSGPPKTASPPGALGQRIYQVLLVETNPKAQASATAKRFYAVRGAYAGLIWDADAIGNETLGSINVVATAEGNYTGKIQIDGKTFTIDGRFDSSGTTVRALSLAKAQPLLLQLQLDLTGATGLSGILSDGVWTASIEANKSSFDASNPCPYAGRYRVEVGANGQSTAGSAAAGLGTVTVDQAGRLEYSGSLPDGTHLTQASLVSAAGDWPLYVSLYDHRGSIIGWLIFTNASDNAGGGIVTWIKPASRTAESDQDGFTNQLPVWLYHNSAPGAGRSSNQQP